MLKKLANAVLLFDFYGPLLTDRQQEVWELYYYKDYSLAEIAESFSISRQGVHDLLKRGEKLLLNYEKKLGLLKKHQLRETKKQEIFQLLDKAQLEKNWDLVKKAQKGLATENNEKQDKIEDVR